MLVSASGYDRIRGMRSVSIGRGAFFLLALAVHLAQLFGYGSRLVVGIGQEKLDGSRGVGYSARRVDAGRDYISDRSRGELFRLFVAEFINA